MSEGIPVRGDGEGVKGGGEGGEVVQLVQGGQVSTLETETLQRT